MKTVTLKKIANGYLSYPSAMEMIPLNEEEAETADYVFVVEVRNYKAYNMPHFIVYSKSPTITPNQEIMYIAQIKSMSEKYKEVLDKAVTLEFDSTGQAINWREFDKSPVPGFFRIYGDIPWYKHPYGVRIVKSVWTN